MRSAINGSAFSNRLVVVPLELPAAGTSVPLGTVVSGGTAGGASGGTAAGTVSVAAPAWVPGASGAGAVGADCCSSTEGGVVVAVLVAGDGVEPLGGLFGSAGSAGGGELVGGPSPPVTPDADEVPMRINAEFPCEKLAKGACGESSCVRAFSGLFHPTALTPVGKMCARFICRNALTNPLDAQIAYPTAAAHRSTTATLFQLFFHLILMGNRMYIEHTQYAEA